jgi:hypothetical protein
VKVVVILIVATYTEREIEEENKEIAGTVRRGDRRGDRRERHRS